jgi:phytoene synthase
VRLGPEDLRDEGLALPESYELCRRIQASHSRTYYFSTVLLPPQVRPHIHALYAFTRYADEIVDNPGEKNREEQLSELERFEAETVAAITGAEVANPVLRAFANTVRAREIELASITAFMESMKMDTRVFRYKTYEELKVYMGGSAAAVGLMVSRIVGTTSEAANEHAEALGVAMQLTNFLRDVKEDWERGRVYLPQEDLKRFGYAEEELGEGVVDERFVELMRFEIDRARRLYEVADEGMGYLPRGRRYPVAVARMLYEAILDRIEVQGYDIFSKRAETSLAYKLAVAGWCAARDPREISARFRDRRRAEIAIPA